MSLYGLMRLFLGPRASGLATAAVYASICAVIIVLLPVAPVVFRYGSY